MVLEKLGLRQTKNHFLQLLGRKGAGCRRLALELLRDQYKVERVAWITPQWSLHAPRLWSMAYQLQILLFGIECPAKRFRILAHELHQSNAFDAWVLEGYRFTQADGFFLQQLTRQQNLKLLFIDEKPHTFCKERIHIALSHDHYRLTWTKGGPPTPQFKNADLFQMIRNPILEYVRPQL